MRIVWKRQTAYRYTGNNGANREYEIEIVGGGGSFRGVANCKQDGRHYGAVGACSSSMPGALISVLNSLKRMCKDFDDGANCTDDISDDAAKLLNI